VITNWPLTNALDALAPQRVLDGLAGTDANIGLHRANVTMTIRDHLTWCGEEYGTTAGALRETLVEMDALPAYLVIGDSFEEAWRVFAEQRAARIHEGESESNAFFATEPCATASVERLRTMRTSLDNHPGVTREFHTKTVTIYKIQ